MVDVWNSSAKGGERAEGGRQGEGWNPCFFRTFNDGEVDYVVRFLTLFARATSLSGCGRFFDMVSDKKWQVYNEVPLSCFRTRLSWIFSN